MLKYQKHQTEAGTTRTDKPATIQRMENNFLATFWALCGRSPANPRPQVFLLCPRTTLSPPPTAGPTFLRCLLYLLWQWDPESKPKPLDGLQPKGGSITSFSSQAIVGVARWADRPGPRRERKATETKAAARLGFCLAICRISMATPNPILETEGLCICGQSDLCALGVLASTFNEVKG